MLKDCMEWPGRVVDGSRGLLVLVSCVDLRCSWREGIYFLQIHGILW